MTDFGKWFTRFTGCESGPHEWQERLATSPTVQNRLVRIPTGMGKTAGIVAAWAWNRLIRSDQTWPRRLVFCLPMRVLVEQTRAEIQRWLKDEDLLWEPNEDHAGRVGVHLLMGGEDGEDWHLYPEHNAVLIGTQDMLLSRTLNRGYGAGRARWPMDFGLLNQDALWVMDEVQLMDVGLATSAQLQAFRHEDQDLGKELRPCRTWWMSATLQPSWLQSVDTSALMATLPPVVEIGSKSRIGGFWDIHKPCKIVAATSESAIAELARSAHQASTLTLVVLNRVETARSVHESLQGLTAGTDIELRLVHSRFRPAERSHWREAFLNKDAPMPAAGRIIVTTQVVEAGVDISAYTLITELAPWSSLVQRFGRCARYAGESGVIRVVDRGWNEKSAKDALPYEVSDLDQAKAALGALPDVSLSSLEAFEENLNAEARQALYPYNPRHLLLRREWDELFDTTPDLSGADIDISRFIRSGEELDCHVFWREVPANGPSDDWQPGRAELCPVPFLKAREWLCGPETKEKRSPRLKPKMRAWVWDWVDGEWRRDTQRKDLLPGRTVLVDTACGGYEVTAGWRPEAKEAVPAITAGLSSAQNRADSAQGREDLSESEWKTIATHGREVAVLSGELALAIGLGSLAPLLQSAGLWHDVGKAHPCFQGSMRHSARPDRQDLAKAPKTAWSHAHLYRSDSEDNEWRPGLRHELGSALALFAALRRCAPNHPALRPRPSDLSAAAVEQAQVLAVAQPQELEVLLQEMDAPAFNLLAYLVASHHGKVRMSLHAAPQDQDYRDTDGHGLPIRGIRHCDKLSEILGQGNSVLLPPCSLTLEPALLGLSEQTGPSWTERVLGLLERHGPGALAFMEAILRAADIRASRLVTPDPLLAMTDHPSSFGDSKEVAE
jgi:CRISPR-associated endonuclease/helicase Cas3